MNDIRKITENVYLDTHIDDEPILYEGEQVKVLDISYDYLYPSCARAKVVCLHSDDIHYICAGKLKFTYGMD